MPSKIQTGPITYELHSLGWKAFQQLCISIISNIWCHHIQSFADSNDGGQDGAFFGTLNNNFSVPGTYTVQCKFTAHPDKGRTLSEYSDELSKISRLVKIGKANSYILMTNARISGNFSSKLEEKIRSEGVNNVLIFGYERICQLIRETPKLRLLLPRVYGLGDLSQILDERAYTQAKEILDSQGDRLSKFVITKSYIDSAKALSRYGFVLLLGSGLIN